MKPRTLLVLLILVLGLGAFIWFYERDLPSSEERVEQSKKVLQLEKDAVTAVTIESAAGPVRLERVDPPKPPEAKKEKEEEEKKEGEAPDADDLASSAPDAEWRITRPLAARADYAAIDGLLSALTGLEKSRTLEDAAAADVGLDKPQATVRLATADGEKVLKFGAAVPTGGAVIVGIDGEDKAYVVPDSILGEIRKAPGDWRDRQMFHARRDEIEGLRLTGPAGQVVLTQLGERFRIDSPIRDLADREKADNLYADLSGLTAERFVDQPERPLAELGLEPPRAVVDVAIRGKAPVRVELGSPVDPAAPPPDPNALNADTGEQLVHARIGKQVFETRTRLAETAARPAADWRALSLTSFDVYAVDSATVQDGQGRLALQRAGTDWKRGEETISYVAVSDLLFAVTGARADRLVPGSLVPGKPVLTITLKPSQGSGETLSFFAPGPAGVPVRANGRDVALLIPAAKLQEIQQGLAEVRKAKPLSADEKKEGE
ncbi:MAG TPA: DUF4340 domain-containing protein [Thermoanaerobaculia bacterium]|nr:DUF4340 domain-containing protein [Thermoanaerobaculia bacterium]